MKLPFRRKKDNSTVPAEIQEYYQSEKRERTGIAWLLALGTLIVTIGLATLLFFGGRWAYRAIVNNDDQDTVQVEENENSDANSNDSEGNTAGESTTNQSAQTGTSSTSTSTPNSPSTPTPSSPAIIPSDTNSLVAGSSTNLPNTGAGDTLALVIATTAFATAAHYVFIVRRANF